MTRWIRQWAPALVWAAFIWTMSTDYFSAAHTASWIKPILRWLDPGMSAHTMNEIHHAIRKSAHVVEYFIFTLLLYRGLRGREPGWHLKWALIALVTAACYSGLDEVHQAFVASRTASPWDSLLDSSGALGAMVVYWLWARPRALRPLPQETPTEIPPRL